MSAGISPASAMAARHASVVRSSGSRSIRRPTSDWPMPLTMTPRSNRSATSQASGFGCGGGREHWKVHIGPSVVREVAEHDPNRHADRHFVRGNVYDVGENARSGILVDLHQGNEVGLWEARQKRLVVLGERLDSPAAAQYLPLE